MDRGTRAFWSIVTVLGAASAYFGVHAERARREVAVSSGAVQTGSVASLSRIIDGDTVVLKTSTGDSVTVRVFGIKAFEAGGAKASTEAHGRQAIEALRHTLEGKPIRVMLGTPHEDRYCRTLATLFVDDEDVGLALVRKGLVLVHTKFPFPSMSEYREAQEAARSEHKGLWSDPVAVERARLLAAAWRSEAP